MVTIEKCKKVLESSGRKYTNEEISLIRDFVYKMSIIEYNEYKKRTADEGGELHKSLNRRPERERV